MIFTSHNQILSSKAGTESYIDTITIATTVGSQHHARASITASIIITSATPTSAHLIANNGNQHQQADKKMRHCEHAPCNEVVIAWASRRFQYTGVPLHAHPQVRRLPVWTRHNDHL
jgi:Fe-S-cluster-containing hydrogenase component 2